MNWKKIFALIVVYLMVIGIYAAFFAYPVDAARMNDSSYSEKESEVYSTLPYTVYKVYVRESINPAILVLATVRTPFIPEKTYSRAFASVESKIENETKERYNADIDLVLKDQRIVQINGKKVAMDRYDIHLRYFNSVGSYFTNRPDTIYLYLGAFFCNEKYESVIIAYVVPLVFSSDFERVISEIHC